MGEDLAYLLPALSIGNFIVRKPLKFASLAGSLRETQDENFRLGISPSERICGYPPSLICTQGPRLIERESAGMTDRARNAAMRRKRASHDYTVVFGQVKKAEMLPNTSDRRTFPSAPSRRDQAWSAPPGLTIAYSFRRMFGQANRSRESPSTSH